MHRFVAVFALVLALAAPAAAGDKRKANPASHEPAFFEALLEGRAYVYAKPHNKDRTSDESDRAAGVLFLAGGKARICTRTRGSTRTVSLRWKILPSDRHRSLVALYKGTDDPARHRFQTVPFYAGEEGRMRLESWNPRERRWLVWTEGWVQEGWPRALADACRKLRLPEDVAVNEVQTEKRIGRLRDQDPEAAVRRFPGWESGDPDARGRGVKPR